VENFMKLASWLAAEMDASVILLGAKNDTEDMSAISEACQSSNLKSAIGETSLQEAISIISKAVLHIGSDSGLTHVAARMDIPTVAIYSGVAPIELWAPYGRHVTIIATPVECSPCYLSAVEDCQNDHKCVRSTDFEFVRSQVRKQLSR
jgi:ADP-heptose:LPS heptosyltransferase